ncbi:putative gag-pol polyprotein [Cucumis melo var. makuwa]|uniref:Gag-pol polyprotein n=1 Tax=Cucumis melo var. makuwa TaxID=1194695 RepID=A0A5A7TP18_CUCMM|nr:putative gag-pol polyprotein [Cucumis melo var. makuwa]
MDQSKSLEENLDEFQKIVVDLNNIGEKMSDENQAVILLNSLPETYREVKAAIKYGRDSLTMSIVLDALKTRNLEIKKERKDGELLMARGRSEKKSWKGKERSFRSKSKGKSRKCFLCHKEGHFKKNCPLNKSREASTSEANVTDGYNSAEITNGYDSAETGYESAEVLMVSHRDIQDAWIMDSGCTFHMTPHRDFLTNFQKVDGGKVLLGDNGTCDVKGTGSVQIATHDGMVRILTNVLYVPKLKRNLISLGELDRSGCTIKSENGVMKVTKGSLVKLKGTLRHGLYVLEGTTVSGSAAIASGKVTDMSMLWHKRLAHVSERGLQALSQQGLLGGVKNVELPFCEHCIMGKSTRVKFGKGKHITKGILDYVHSDLWGPTKEVSMGGSRYFISIIDDFSRKVWIYPLKQKDEAFGKFLEWKKQVENQTGRKVKYLRTDNGLEFVNNKFNQFCKSEGITRHFTVTYTPQQNGLAERFNRTIMERTRCLLTNASLPLKFWGEAAQTACYLINRSPSTALNLKTPQEVWTGKAPSLEHLRVFGCTAYAHVKDGKLNKRALKCIFIGYPQGVKGYKLWCIEKGMNKCIISRDVTFNETEMPYCVKEQQKQQTGDHVVTEVRIASEVRPSIDLDNQPPLVSEIEDTQQSEFDGIQSQQERILIDEGAFIEESSSNNDLQNYQLTRDRVQRERHAPIRYGYADLVAYALTCAADSIEAEPLTFEEAIVSDSKKQWKDAMEEELFSLHKNQTWSLVPKPPNQKLIQSKWIYKIKPVVRHSSIRLILSIAVHFDMFIEQMDVTTTFLHGELEEVIYMAQPKGYEVKGKEDMVCRDMVCRLHKSLYGLKQSPRQWYIRFDTFILKQGSTETHMMLVFTGNNLKKVRTSIYCCELKRILGMDVKRDKEKGLLTISQESYVIKLLEKYNMSDSKAVSTPLASHFRLSSSQCPVTKQERIEMSNIPYCNAVGSIMYLMICTRPDLGYAMSSASVSLCYSRDCDKSTLLEGFTDADYAADLDKRSQLLLCRLRTEYISLGEAVKEAVWLKRIVGELLSQEFIPIIHCDSQNAIHLAKNPSHHERSKHIDVKFHYIRNVIAQKDVELVKVHTVENLSDMLTKALSAHRTPAACGVFFPDNRSVFTATARATSVFLLGFPLGLFGFIPVDSVGLTTWANSGLFSIGFWVYSYGQRWSVSGGRRSASFFVGSVQRVLIFQFS